ncbi:MAG: DUF4167 domain-containing protein, partial [Micavibrio aeruginosavorus]
SNRRSRNRGHNNGQQHQARKGTHNRNQIFDSNGPDVRIRGTAHQVCEKYLALAKDASSVGDVVLAESYLQHAEHYQRIINSWNEEFQSMPRQSGFVQSDDQPSADDLSLPVSILGGDVKAKEQESVRQSSFQNDQMLETA